MTPSIALLLIAAAVVAFGIGAIIGYFMGARSVADQYERMQ